MLMTVGLSGRDLGLPAAVADQHPRQRQVVGDHGDDVVSVATTGS